MLRRKTCVLLCLLLVASAACAGWRPWRALEQSMLFHPAPYPQSWLEPPEGISVEDVWLTTPDGTQIHGWWYEQPFARGAILFCHGNAGNVSHWLASGLMMARQLNQSVLIFDYPGYGRSTGSPSEAGCYAAARAARDWLTTTKKIDARDLILYGQSLGGGVAVELAAEQPPRALVLIKTFTSIPDMARKSWLTSASAPLVTNRFASIDKIGKCGCPVFIAHGDQDRLIPLAQGKKLYEAAKEPKHFCLLAGSGHNDVLPLRCYDEMKAFIAASK